MDDSVSYKVTLNSVLIISSQAYPLQDCPIRTIGRCVCPDHKPVLRREGETVCVQANSCEAPDWFKLGPTGLKNFKFNTVSQ